MTNDFKKGCLCGFGIALILIVLSALWMSHLNMQTSGASTVIQSNNGSLKRSESFADRNINYTEIEKKWSHSEAEEVEETEESDVEGFIYPEKVLENPNIIFVPNDEVLRTFPPKVVYGVYCALTESLGTEPADFFVASWDNEGDRYNVKIGFNSGATVDLQIDTTSGAYKYNKTLQEAQDDYQRKQARGEEIYTFPQETVDKFIEIVKTYSGLSNPELTTLNERNCCWVIWYNDAGTDRFIKLDKTTEEMIQRGHYDDLKEEYVVDWEVEE